LVPWPRSAPWPSHSGDVHVRLCYFGDAISVHLQRWTEWFARRGHDVHLFSLNAYDIPGVDVHVLPFAKRGAWEVPQKAAYVRRAVSDLRPDLVHAHFALGYGLWGVLSRHRPLVVSAWGSDVLVGPERSWLDRQVLRFVLRRATLTISVATHLRDRMVKYGLRADRAVVIPMGVDLDRYPPQPYRIRTRSIGFVSTRTLEPIYDLETLIRAAAEIFRRFPEARGQIVGGGSLKSSLERFATTQGLMGRLEFRGPLPSDTLMNSLAMAQVYVSTSKSDGASVSLLEAMSRGCFPIVTDIAANREWIENGKNGFVFPVGDAQALAERVSEAIGDETLLVRASAANIRKVQEAGNLRRNLERVEGIYARLLEGGK